MKEECSLDLTSKLVASKCLSDVNYSFIVVSICTISVILSSILLSTCCCNCSIDSIASLSLLILCLHRVIKISYVI